MDDFGDNYLGLGRALILASYKCHLGMIPRTKLDQEFKTLVKDLINDAGDGSFKRYRDKLKLNKNKLQNKTYKKIDVASIQDPFLLCTAYIDEPQTGYAGLGKIVSMTLKGTGSLEQVLEDIRAEICSRML